MSVADVLAGRAQWAVEQGDCFDVLPTLDAACVDAVVTDPPYALGFMGKAWDRIGDTGRGARARVERAPEVTPAGRGHSTSAGPYLAAGIDSLRSAGRPFQAWCSAWATEVLRILKPGGYMVCFGGTRTYHRLTCAVEDAGFEIRDCLMWLYGSGFPKADSCLKPAYEPILLCRKPGRRVLPLGIEECRIDYLSESDRMSATPQGKRISALRPGMPIQALSEREGQRSEYARSPLTGRWPANVLHDGSPDVLEAFARFGDHDAGASTTGKEPSSPAKNVYGQYNRTTPFASYADTGSAARFFYSTRSGEPSADSENQGAVGFHMRPGMRRPTEEPSRFFYAAKASRSERGPSSTHPTVKPLALMEWLVKLVCPEGGLVLDPFLGSGTTAVACDRIGRRVIGIEQSAEYCALAVSRLVADAPLFNMAPAAVPGAGED